MELFVLTNITNFLLLIVFQVTYCNSVVSVHYLLLRRLDGMGEGGNDIINISNKCNKACGIELNNGIIVCSIQFSSVRRSVICYRDSLIHLNKRKILLEMDWQLSIDIV